ncbi:hypothetical protein BVRB_6g131890 [Beta vulgaris subsp. vulgaris]|nr:hypothetical protein BVRB_6g131890 [Beta vulgaris subsp. vulgaris]
MFGGKVQGSDECRNEGEHCNLLHGCCSGTLCSSSIWGGTCEKGEVKAFGCGFGREEGVECGILVPAMCCGRLRCSNHLRGVCEKD